MNHSMKLLIILVVFSLLLVVACGEEGDCSIDGKDVPCDQLDDLSDDMFVDYNNLPTPPSNYLDDCVRGFYKSEDPNYRIIKVSDKYGSCFIYSYDNNAIMKEESPKDWAAQEGTFGKVCLYMSDGVQCENLTTANDFDY